MRLSLDGKRLVYVAGLGQRPVAPMVTVVQADGAQHAIGPGHDPCWLDADTALWCPQEDGKVLGSPRIALPAGNTLAAGGGMAAVGRTDPRRVILSQGGVFYGGMDPAISDDGRWIAYVLADIDATGKPREGISTLYVERTDGSQAARVLWEGAPTRPRFGGTTLVWEIGRGLIAGCADVSNPAVAATAFTLPSAWKLTHPVPVWVPTRGELLVLFVADAGETGAIYLASWTSLKVGEPRGYALGASTGSAFDHDARPISGTPDGVAICWLDPAGLLDGVNVGLGTTRVILAPPAKPEPPPTPHRDDSFDLVPDGTLVQDAIATLIGRNPVRQGEIICLHKNVGEAEWRRVRDGELLHWADDSRYPGDPGWWIEPAPVWALDTFRSGQAVSTEGAEVIDLRPGVKPNRWRQTNTLYGLKGGGVCVQFDPRFPGMYTDVAKVGTPGYTPVGYERHYNLRDGRVRWEFLVTPLTNKGVLPWGDRSRDVVIQSAEAGPSAPGVPLPFKPCPRPLSSTPKPEPKPMSDPKPELRGIPRDQIVLMAQAISLYLHENPRLGLPDGLLDRNAGTRPLGEALDATCAYLIGECLSAFQAEGPLPGDAAGYAARRDRALAHTFHVIEAERGEKPAVQPGTPRPPFAGPISVAGRDFVTP